MVTLLQQSGASFIQFQIAEFSVTALAAACDIVPTTDTELEDLASNERDVSIKVATESKLVIVQFFYSDGDALTFFGPIADFVSEAKYEGSTSSVDFDPI